MSAWFRLNINAESLGLVEIRRQEHLDLSDPAAIADAVSTYEVKRDGVLVGEVKHWYGDGAWKLVGLACELITEHNERSLT